MSTDWTFSWACCQAIHHNSSATDWLSQCVCLQGFQSPPGQWSLGWDRHCAVYGILSAHVLGQNKDNLANHQIHYILKVPKYPSDPIRTKMGCQKHRGCMAFQQNLLHLISTLQAARESPALRHVPLLPVHWGRIGGLHRCKCSWKNTNCMRQSWRIASVQNYLPSTVEVLWNRFQYWL